MSDKPKVQMLKQTEITPEELEDGFQLELVKVVDKYLTMGMTPAWIMGVLANFDIEDMFGE